MANTDSKSTSNPSPNFSQSQEALGKILDRFRSDALPLEEALTLFEEGVQHLKACQSVLQTSRGRVEELVQSLKAGGAAVTQPFGDYGAEDEEESSESESLSNLAPQIQRYRLMAEALANKLPSDPVALTPILEALSVQLGFHQPAPSVTLATAEDFSAADVDDTDSPMPAWTVTITHGLGALTLQGWPDAQLLSIFLMTTQPFDEENFLSIIEAGFDTEALDFQEF